jgi:hypothetical protein
MKRPATTAVILIGLVSLTPLQARAQADRWSFSLMPYLWLPSVDGKVSYGPSNGGSANVSIDADDYLDNLDFALMFTGEARKGRWLIGTDVMYLDFSNATSTVRSVDFNPGSGPINIATTELDGGTRSSLEGWVWTLGGGYAAVQEPGVSLDVIGGFRLLTLDVETDWQLTATVTGTGPLGETLTFERTGSVGESEDLWAGIVGAKGRVKLGEGNWFFNYYADIGGGSSLFTWQGAAGIGTTFGWGDVVLDYRYLYYDQSGDKLVQDMSFGGLALGANFRF